MVNRMKKNIIRGILILLLFCTFGIIFGFSSQNAEKSGGISQKITEVLTSKMKWIQEKPETEKEQILNRIESIIRKIAHFSIYTIVRNFIDGFISYLSNRRNGPNFY